MIFALKTIAAISIAALSLGGCSSSSKSSEEKEIFGKPLSDFVQSIPIFNGAKDNRHDGKVLEMARRMTEKEKTIVRGSCWDYVNEVFNRAGYPQAKRKTVFSGKYPNGPFADKDLIQPGDWLYFVNHSYNDIQHSSMFIEWVDKSKSRARLISYAGEGRKEPARYKTYDISHVYKIIRAAD